jgi:methylenetetrahydrofolate reductase (NADPH)
MHDRSGLSVRRQPTAPSGETLGDSPESKAEQGTIRHLLQHASIEMTVRDAKHLQECRAQLGRPTDVFISHMPKQQWEETHQAVTAVRHAGLEPVPHLPARAFESHAQLESVLGYFAKAQVRRALIIAGDRATPLGPFDSTLDIVRTGLLRAHGITEIYVAGHPEGHAHMSADQLRANEREKVEAAERAGLAATFVTQFSFDSACFIEWIKQLRTSGIHAPVVIGLAAPARLTTLIKFGTVCGIGASLRFLTTRAGNIAQLATERGPEPMIRALARAHNRGVIDIAGLHFFAFGGFKRTCAWMGSHAREVTHADDALHVATRG